MGSGIGVVEETVDKLVPEGQKVGVLKVRLFRPWDTNAFVAALPKTVKHIAVLDRTKEPGAAGEPLYQDVVTSWPRLGREARPARQSARCPGDRRPLRALLEGIYARHGRRRVPGIDQGPA